MRSARLSRAEHARFCTVAHASKRAADIGKSQIDVPLDVFEEDPRRLRLAHDARDVRPEVARIVRAALVAGDRERLARITRSDEVHDSTPRAAVEGCEIVPNRRVAQGRVVHPGHECGRRMGVSLDITHSAGSRLGDVEAEIEAAVAGAEREKPELVGT
jgi:hypothetical protein